MKKRNIRSFMSFVMILAMIFTSIGASFINPYVANAEGNTDSQELTVSDTVYNAVYSEDEIETQEQKIRIRVEGKDATLCDKEVTIIDEKTALDVLKTAVKEDNIKFNKYNIVNEILGERADYDLDQGAYWGLYIITNNEISEGKGASEQTIDGLDEILFHVNKSTGLPVLEYKQDGDKQKIIVKSNVWGNINLVKGANIEIIGQKYTTDDNGEAIVTLSEGEYIVTVYKNNVGEYPELIKCGQKISVNYKNIKILLDLDMLTVGSTLNLKGKVLDQNGNEINHEVISWYTSNAEVATVDKNTGVVKGIKEGKVTITAKLTSNETITASIDLLVEEKKTNEQKIKEAIDDLRKHYAKDSQFTLTEALGYKFTSNNIQNDLAMIKSKYKISSNLTSASEYANAIIGLIALGENPRDYSGKDYVEGLVQLQNKEGKFILDKWDDYPTVSAISIIALDMAKADYRVGDAAKALMSYQNDDGTFGPYKDIDTLAMSIKGIYNHKDLAGANQCIDKAVNKLLAENKNTINTSNANTLASVIQGIVSIGENPLASKWTVDGKTMLNSIFKYKNGDTFGNDLATEQVFAALADLHKKESMYTGAKISGEGYDNLFIPNKNDNTGGGQIEEGDKACISVKGSNKNIISRTEIKLEKGDTVLNVTKRILDSKGISYTINNDGYFKKITGEGEFDQGAKSGWMYNVNGTTILESAQDCYVKNGDEIEWYYTKDYTSDSRNTNIGGSIQEGIISKEIEQAKNILDNKNASESDMTKAVKDVTDKLNEKVNTIKSEEDAKKIVKDVKEFSGVIEKAMDRIITKEGAKSFANESINIVKSLVKTSEKINQDSDKKEISEAAASNMKNTLKAMDKIHDTKEINKIAGDMIEASGSLMKKIGKENAEEIKEQALKIVEKAVALASTQKVEKEQLKLEGNKAVASINESKIKDLVSNFTKTAKEMKEILSKNDVENKEFEKKLAIAVGDTAKQEVEVSLPSNLMKTVKENGVEKVGIKTEVAAFNITLKTFGEKAENKELSLSARKVDRNELSAIERNNIPEGSTIVDLNARVGEEKVSTFEEPIEITIPYEGKVEEGKNVKVFFLTDNGTIEEVGGVYDAVTKTVSFTTGHFSKYFAKQVDQDQEVKNKFTDIKAYPWAKESIETMADKNIISGRSEAVFDPSANITRAEFAALITKLFNIDTEEEAPFKDVEKTKWYYKAVASAYKEGFISGRSETTFDPKGNITREEMAAIIANALEKKGYEKEKIEEINVFKDKESVAQWAKEGVSLCVKEKIITGMGDNKFSPKQKANRAQAAVMLHKLYNLIIE